VLEDEEVLASILPTTTTQEDIEEEDEEEEDESPENSRVDEVEGFPKLNKKKRKRRNQLRTSRRGSKGNNSQIENETETVSEFAGDDMFSMDDVQQGAMEETVELPIPTHGQKTPSRHLSSSSSKDNQESCDPTIALLEPLQAVFLTEALSSEGLLTRTTSVSADFQFFPCPGQPEEVDGLAPKLGTAPSTAQPDTTTVWRWGEPMMEVQAMQEAPVEVVKQEPEPDKSEEEVKSSSWLGMFRGSRSSQSPGETGGVYLDDIVNDPEKRAFYLQPNLEVCVGPSDPLDLTHIPRAGLDQPLDDDCESGTGPSLPMSPQSLIVSPPAGSLTPGSTDDLVRLVSCHLPDLAVSLCGGLTDRSITPAQFNSGLLTYQQFQQKIKEASPILEDPSFVIRLHEKYVSWSTASPILLSLMFFKKPMPADVIEDILKDGLPVNLNLSAEEANLHKESTKKGSSWFRWFGSSSEQPNQEGEVKTELLPADIKTETVEEDELLLPILGTPRKRLETETTYSDSDLGGEKRRWKKTLRLTPEQLASLNLQKGSNEVDFSVTTRIQGTTVCRCHIYLWHHTDKVVISDIDGTITKSDMLGHFLPMVGRDWAQSGVADLFSKIRANGYHIMYLSARAIGQASMTKDYLELLRQGEVCLPDGPVFLNPESLIHAFKREVIDKNPEEFKIRCLKDIETLFGGKNPFFAGYGNKPNVRAAPAVLSFYTYISCTIMHSLPQDAYAYRALGIPVSRIFTINPAGELKHELTHNFQTS
jgi:phosphatidate phosphatase LPIN